MPFFLDPPEVVEDFLAFRWGESYDFDAEDITYLFEVASDWEFKNVVYSQSLVNQHSAKIQMLVPGTYFWRVTATNKSGKTMYPFDVYVDDENIPHSGMKYLYITPEGKVMEE